ncbi:MAG: hypothetical protein IKX26_04065, partial [Bacteroidales bacterium]|nr:hypothetical protein [Bacteroidales bacterium]
VISYFNQNYVKTEIFPKEMSKMIRNAMEHREKADYLDFYIASKEEAAKCKRNVSRWAEEDSKAHSSGKGIGEWIFKDISPKESIPDEYSL